MCSNCGFPMTVAHWTEAGAATAMDRIRSRFRRAAVLRDILEPFGLLMHDDGMTQGVVISDKTGRIELVEDLTGLWITAERLLGRPVDPLDPRFTAPEGP